jgi:hypothetical protein
MCLHDLMCRHSCASLERVYVLSETCVQQGMRMEECYEAVR